jgi:hypothetical protein
MTRVQVYSNCENWINGYLVPPGVVFMADRDDSGNFMMITGEIIYGQVSVI